MSTEASTPSSTTSPAPSPTPSVKNAAVKYAPNFCLHCGAALALLAREEDGGPKSRLRCGACDWTHWNNPTPVLAAIIECSDRDGQVLLARNAAWPGRMFALITGFMEAGETPEEGITREVAEETSLTVDKLSLVGVYDFQRMNQIIIAYHALAHGDVKLSPELAEYKLFAPADLRCWRAGTGYALADWLRSNGHDPQFIEFPSRADASSSNGNAATAIKSTSS
jgi:NAD+ diphosphatase